MNTDGEHPHNSDFKVPADIDHILDRFGYLLHHYKNVKEKYSIYSQYKRTPRRLEVLFPFIQHPIHGITGLHAIEKYDSDGNLERYHYNWKVIIPKQGVALSHISSWGNDAHDEEWTPEELKIKTEPHHHHYDPNDRSKRRENYEVRSLESAFAFIEYYLVEGLEYVGLDNRII